MQRAHNIFDPFDLFPKEMTIKRAKSCPGFALLVGTVLTTQQQARENGNPKPTSRKEKVSS